MTHLKINIGYSIHGMMMDAANAEFRDAPIICFPANNRDDIIATIIELIAAGNVVTLNDVDVFDIVVCELTGNADKTACTLIFDDGGAPIIEMGARAFNIATRTIY